MPIRLCSTPTCHTPATYRGYCATHAKARNRATHNPHNKAIYNTKKWRMARRKKLFESPICQKCDHQLATDVHHIRDLDQGGDPYAPHNLEALCHSCHSQITRASHA